MAVLYQRSDSVPLICFTADIIQSVSRSFGSQKLGDGDKSRLHFYWAFGTKKTLACVYFYWRAISGDVRKFVQSCTECQKPAKHSSVRHSPSPYLASRPFEHVSVDILDAISVASKRSFRYIFSFIYLCTPWIEAAPMKCLTADEAAVAHLSIFCRVGFPDAILYDNVLQFVSRALQSFADTLYITQSPPCLVIATTPEWVYCRREGERV